MIIPLGMSREDHSLGRARERWSLPWTWLTTKSKYLGLLGLSSPSALGLPCLLNPNYLGLG